MYTASRPQCTKSLPNRVASVQSRTIGRGAGDCGRQVLGSRDASPRTRRSATVWAWLALRRRGGTGCGRGPCRACGDAFRDRSFQARRGTSRRSSAPSAGSGAAPLFSLPATSVPMARSPLVVLCLLPTHTYTLCRRVRPSLFGVRRKGPRASPARHGPAVVSRARSDVASYFDYVGEDERSADRVRTRIPTSRNAGG